MAIREIPLTSDGAQLFNVVIGGVTYSFFISYNTRENIWTLDISSEAVKLVSGVALVGGVDLLKQYDIGFTGLWMVNVTDSEFDASGDNLGTDVLLFLVDQVSIDEAIALGEDSG